MYEVINITTKKSLLFVNFAAADAWVKKNGGWDLFRIFPW